MRLQPETVLVVCLCLWIPVAPSYGALASEDQDGSGSGDEFSGSGSGDDDDDNWIFEARPPTQASPINTTVPWSTDVPTNPPKRPVTIKIVTETPSHLTEAPLPHTTQITETEPTEDIIPFTSGDVPKAKTTTFSTVAQPETTVPPAVKLPALPEPADEYTTEATDEKDPTESSVLEPEETTVDDAAAVATEAPDMETTPVLLHATPDSNSADADASGDSVESTTAQDEGVHFIETNIIPEEHAPKIGDPRTNDNDFDFNNEIRKPRLNSEPPGSESDFARGSASDNDSLLERKEVLAGVIAGGVVGLAFAIMLISLMVYRMKKKDEGSYSLDEHKHPNGGYQKAQKQEEFLA